MRLDRYLTENGFAESRTKAQSMIRDGVVYVDGKPIDRPSFDVDEVQIEIRGETLAYVGRGGLKLEGALDVFGISPTGLCAVDIGASTGGFTHCLLMRGAKRVYAVDAGHDQLHESLRHDSRVVSMEGVNARTLSPALLGEICDLAVMDVSFISQALLYPAISSVLSEEGMLISLIKPQFETGTKRVGKNGIVRDRTVYEAVITRLVNEAALCGLYAQRVIDSPIAGGDGNREFLALFSRTAPITVTHEEIKILVYSTQKTKK